MNRNTTRRGLIIVAAIMTGFLCLAASAFASGAIEHAVGTNAAVNPNTCKFVKPEVDPPTGPTWKNLRAYVIYEDARHDAKLSCLTRKVGGFKTPPPVQLQTKIVTATGTGQTVTATCPAGFSVTGGGSKSETTGSYPSSSSAWTVVRDHLSPRVLDATAICVRLS